MNDKIKQIEINKIKKAKKMTQKDKTRLLNIGLSIGEVEKLEQELLKQEQIKKATFEDLENLELSEQELKQEQINKLIKKYNVTDVEVSKYLKVSNSAISNYSNKTKKNLMKLAIAYIKDNKMKSIKINNLLSNEKVTNDLKNYNVKKQDVYNYLDKNSGTFYQYAKEKQALFILGYLFLVKNSLV